MIIAYFSAPRCQKSSPKLLVIFDQTMANSLSQRWLGQMCIQIIVHVLMQILMSSISGHHSHLILHLRHTNIVRLLRHWPSSPSMMTCPIRPFIPQQFHIKRINLSLIRCINHRLPLFFINGLFQFRNRASLEISEKLFITPRHQLLHHLSRIHLDSFSKISLSVLSIPPDRVIHCSVFPSSSHHLISLLGSFAANSFSKSAESITNWRSFHH